MTRQTLFSLTAAALIVATIAGCAKKQPPVARPMPPPAATAAAPAPPPAPPEPVTEPVPVPPEPLAEDEIGSRSLDNLNRESPLKPVFFELDNADVPLEGQRVLQETADVLRKYSTWQVTIEGHCDERGTAEYNLALGERRALAARDYLVSLGIAAERLRTVSYGKEFPFDPAQNEAAYATNRRAHFVITAR